MPSENSPSSDRDHTSIAPLPVASWSQQSTRYALTAALPLDNTEIDLELSIVRVFELFPT